MNNEIEKYVITKCLSKNELKHFGILGMKWGVRRYQNKDGSLTAAGKRRLAEKGIRTEENLVEKTIPKGTKIYRTTPYETDTNPNKPKYVTYLDSDRALYREGSIVNSYVNKQDNIAYEHEYELKTDIRIPSLKRVREIEEQIISKNKYKQEIIDSRIKMETLMDNCGDVSITDLNDLYNISKNMPKYRTPESKKLYDDFIKKYGEIDGDRKYYIARGMADAAQFVNANDKLIIEQSLGVATNVKQQIISKLKKEGYNAMYDNASIGVKSDGSYSKTQEAVEPLIIFDPNTSMKEISSNKITSKEQNSSKKTYDDWKQNRDKVLRKFK